eukprot:gene4380-6778_t
MANCSQRESVLMKSCEGFATMCRGLGGASKGCQQTNAATTGDCECYGSVVTYVAETPGFCYVVDECGEPTVSRAPTCIADIGGIGCAGDEYTKCRYGASAEAFDACVEARQDEPCSCAYLYYQCMRTSAGCEEFIAQQACDDLVDSFLAAGYDPTSCNYLINCRCRSAAGRHRPRSWLLTAVVAGAALLIT